MFVQGGKLPVSKSPLTTMQAGGVGVGVGVGDTVGVGVVLGVAVGVGVDAPVDSISVKASCWDCPLMVTRPSSHEVTCLVAMAEP